MHRLYPENLPAGFSLEPKDVSTFLTIGEQAASLGAKLCGKYFRGARSLSAEYEIDLVRKPDGSPVSRIDSAVGDFVITKFKQTARWADWGFLTEENGSANTEARHVYVSDPIDGTAGFALLTQCQTTTSAIRDSGIPVIGMISDLFLKKHLAGIRGGRVFCNGLAVDFMNGPSTIQGEYVLLESSYISNGMETYFHSSLGRAGAKLHRIGGVGSAAVRFALGGAAGLCIKSVNRHDLDPLLAIFSTASGVSVCGLNGEAYDEKISSGLIIVRERVANEFLRILQ